MRKLMDANVNLRYWLSDHPEFSEKARKTIAEGTHTLPEVMGEVVYVRKGVYKVERSEIRSAIGDFMDEVAVDNQEIIAAALSIYAEISLDFVACVLIAYHRITGIEVVSLTKN